MHAPTCETLMRSRYTAFVRGRRDYLLATWHPDTRPAHLDLDADRPPRWLGLKIIAASDQPPRVEFIARYRVAGKAHRLHERSRFVYAEGRWWYLDGELEPHEAGTRSDGASR